jgi:hypothetical protein
MTGKWYAFSVSFVYSARSDVFECSVYPRLGNT